MSREEPTNESKPASKGIDCLDWFSISNGWLTLGGEEYGTRYRLDRLISYEPMGLNVSMMFDAPIGLHSYYHCDGQNCRDLIDALDAFFRSENVEIDHE